MEIPRLDSIQDISVLYETGDLPVQVLCSDKQQYICKYMRPNATIAYKLACELIGSTFAEAWKINTPQVALVHIKPVHWTSVNAAHNASAPAIGFRKIDGVIDITPTSYRQVSVNRDTLYQLLKIALFDFWIANEDRTYNNANLLYEIENDRLVSIDYGGILNNVSFDYPLAQLTETDSILCSELFEHISNSVTPKSLEAVLLRLEKDYQRCITQSRKQLHMADKMPREWAIPIDKITNKLNELLSAVWIDATWTNFVECLKSNSNYGK